MLDASGLGVKEALFSNEPFPLPGRRCVTGDPRSGERRGLKTTAVNIFEKQRNLLWVNNLKSLITYRNYNSRLMHIVFYIVDANLIVKLGDIDKDRVTPDHPDNPLSKC